MVQLDGEPRPAQLATISHVMTCAGRSWLRRLHVCSSTWLYTGIICVYINMTKVSNVHVSEMMLVLFTRIQPCDGFRKSPRRRKSEPDSDSRGGALRLFVTSGFSLPSHHAPERSTVTASLVSFCPFSVKSTTFTVTSARRPQHGMAEPDVAIVHTNAVQTPTTKSNKVKLACQRCRDKRTKVNIPLFQLPTTMHVMC